MHLLPPTLAAVADVGDTKDRGGRFSLAGVRLRLDPDGTYLAEATDTKMLLRVSGPVVDKPEEYPVHPALAAAPDGQAEGIVPLAVWQSAFKTADKVTRKIKGGPLRSAAVKLGRGVVTIACRDFDTTPAEQSKLAEGRFPPVDDILRDTREKPLLARFAADPALLARLLKAVAATACDPDSPRVEFEVRAGHGPVLLAARNSAGTRADALVMPLSCDDTVRPREPDPEEVKAIDRLAARCAALEREGEAREESWRAAVADRDATIATLLAQAATKDERYAELARAVQGLEAENARLARTHRQDGDEANEEREVARAVENNLRAEVEQLRAAAAPRLTRRERLALAEGGAA